MIEPARFSNKEVIVNEPSGHFVTAKDLNYLLFAEVKGIGQAKMTSLSWSAR